MANTNNYILSEHIKMYPTALRGGTDLKDDGTADVMIYDPESRLTTEFNITTLINRLSLNGSFVISSDDTGVELSIHGYYFKITKTGLNGLGYDGNGDLYACIKLKSLGTSSTNTKYTLTSLIPFFGNNTNLDTQQGQSTLFKFEGLYFTSDSSVIDNVNTFGLLLYRKGEIPHDSWFKFDPKAVKIADGYSLRDIIFKEDSRITIKSDEFKGHLTGDVTATNITATEIESHLTGNVTGNLTGNADTSTNSEFSAHIGTNSTHPKIGSFNNPVYVDEKGTVKPGITIRCENRAPTEKDKANDGDIWFQYV